MSKSIKLKNDVYINSTGITHKRQSLYNILNTSNINLTFNEDYVYSSDLDYRCIKIGNIVLLCINTIAFKVENIPNYSTLISGLPKPNVLHIFYLFPSKGTAEGFRVHLNTDGVLKTHWASPPIYGNSANNQYNGTIIYITNE